LVQGVYTDNSDVEVEVIVADLDVEGADEEDILTMEVEHETDETKKWIAHFTAAIHPTGEAPKYVSKMFDRVEARDRRWKVEGVIP
jgi:hypothetical protein